MPLHLERIDWMSSPPLAPDDGPIDFAHLSRMTLGDPALECEVLTMFVAQSARLLDKLAGLPVDAGSIAHTLKGSARVPWPRPQAGSKRRSRKRAKRGARSTPSGMPWWKHRALSRPSSAGAER